MSYSFERLGHYPENAFKEPVAFVKLKAGERLWKLTSHSLIGHGGKISPWWLPFEPNEQMKSYNKDVLGYSEIERRARNACNGRVGNHLKEYIRAWGNVCYDWNGMSNFLLVRADRDLEAVFGRFCYQPIISEKGVAALRKAAGKEPPKSLLKGELEKTIKGAEVTRFIAGNSICQLWIPGLKMGDLQPVS